MFKKMLIIMLSVLIFSNAYAQGHGRNHHNFPGSHHGKHHGNGGYFVGGVILGTILASIPSRREVVYVNNSPYYYYNGVYYQQIPQGYVVVNPIVTQSPMQMAQETVIINVPNKDGSYTSVTLIKTSTGYIGPQGEFYQNNPTVAQLTALYSK
jgi:hypothetical protein